MILPETKTELVRRGNKVVYDLGDKIAKVFNETKPVSDVFNEALNLARINECGIRSPKALEVAELEGDEAGWALITTKVPGVTLAEKIEAEPRVLASTLSSSSICRSKFTGTRLPSSTARVISTPA